MGSKIVFALLAILCVIPSPNAFGGAVLVSPLDQTAQTVTTNKHVKSADLSPDSSPYAPGTNNFAFDLGQVFLMGGLSDHYDNSIGGQLHYTYGVSDLFGFDGSAGYSSHSDGKFSMASLLLGMRMNLSYYDHLIPYSIFGLGFYKPSIAYDNGTGGQDSLSPILFGMHLGFGVDLALTNDVFFGAGLTFHDVFGGDQTTPTGAKVSTGGSFTSFLLHVGYTL